MNKELLKNVAKWVWMAAVLAFIVFYAISKKALIARTFSMLPLEVLLGAAVLVLLAKLCLVANMRLAAAHFKIALGWRDCYCIYNLTQLAKYIPGSIWHFVGRITILRERGIGAEAIRDSLLAEHLWVIASAVLFAVVLAFTGIRDFFEAGLADFDPGSLSLWLLVAFVLFVGSAVLALLLSRRLLRWVLRLLPPPGAIPALFFTWILLGASLWVTLGPFASSKLSIPYVIGVYCFAYVLGFLVPFAPAGLGIREAILTFAMTPFMAADLAILLTALHRMIYFTVEIALAAFCMRRKMPGSS
jgi:hypothetical protein